MKIALLSDIHREFHKSIPEIDPNVDVIVLAGDIAVGEESILTAIDYHELYEKPVIFVAGNHEHYNGDIVENFKLFRHLASQASKEVYVLENDFVTINGVRFLGCTLWSDFELRGEAEIPFAMWTAQKFIADYSYIKVRGSRLTPFMTEGFHKESIKYLKRELAKPFNGKTIVVTHFAPCIETIHKQFLTSGRDGGIDELTPYFVSDCKDLFLEFNIDVWMYGHSHNSFDSIVEDVRVVSNQRGYPSEKFSYTGFDRYKIVEV